MSDYFVLTAYNDGSYSEIWDFPDSLNDIEMPAEGTEMGDAYAPGTEFRMTDEVRGLKIPDVVKNALSYLMISRKTRTLLEEHASAPIEFLPFVLLNHKGRVADDDFHIANILGIVDCVDTARTMGQRDDTGEYFSIRELHLDENRIPPDVNLFRIAEFPKVIVVHEDLRAALDADETSGVHFVAMGEKFRVF